MAEALRKIDNLKQIQQTVEHNQERFSEFSQGGGEINKFLGKDARGLRGGAKDAQGVPKKSSISLFYTN